MPYHSFVQNAMHLCTSALSHILPSSQVLRMLSVHWHSKPQYLQHVSPESETEF